MIHYQSTRGSEHYKSGAKAVIQGIAEDGGLYVPSSVPPLPFDVEDMIGKSYKEIALPVLQAFFGDYTTEELQACVDGAYDSKFDAPDIVPVVKAEDAYFMELYHGKTAAFKDMALSIMPLLLTTALKKEKEDKSICILTATSGDTGKAALAGYEDLPGTEIIVFYPKDGVSEVQEQQMVTQTGSNTHVVSIRGNFDDAQTGVKKIFDDGAFNTELAEAGYKLSSANSINIGRLVPQVAYYVYGYIKLLEQGAINTGEAVNVVVPTGNFGNILAAYYAAKMGIPVNKFICASNENNVLTDFIQTGTYDLHRDFELTTSPSMDILISSNLERLLYHLSGDMGEEIAAYMQSLKTDKEYTVSDTIKAGLQKFYGGYATMDRVEELIGNMFEKHGYLMDTHTAVGYRVYKDYIEKTGDKTPALLASTASAYKFAEAVGRALGLPAEQDGFACIEAVNKKTGVPVPEGLKDLKNKPVLHDKTVDIADMEAAVRQALGK